MERGPELRHAPTPPSASRPRYVSVIGSWRLRATVGAIIAALAVVLAVQNSGTSSYGTATSVFALAWLLAVATTDKYTHKYPYRYYSYLVASHVKAGAIMALGLGAASFLMRDHPALVVALWQALAWCAVADLVVSLPRRLAPLSQRYDPSVLKSREIAGQADPSATASAPPRASATEAGGPSFAEAGTALDAELLAHIQRVVPDFHGRMSALVITDRDYFGRGAPSRAPVDLIVSSVRINDVRRINRFLLGCGEALKMGGHLVCVYEPLENRRSTIDRRYGALSPLVFFLHFIWYRAFPKIPLLNKAYFALTRGRDRALSKAEVWGRLSFCGLKVVREEGTDARRFVTAERIALPITNRRPSYYPVVGLSKVGLDGQVLKTHKVRSMYPFSEFLQKQIFEAHGLVGTGKFKDDFRLTEYGKFLRRHWIDEVPQLFDWLHGDIKLVGMRATSPHFLSLYPPEFIQLYVQVKPGLVPPLFEEGTDGFDAIVDIESRYLRAHVRAPFRTDAKLLWDTFRAIVFRGVRSK